MLPNAQLRADLVARQLWNLPTETSSQTQAHCTPFTLPSNGVIQLGDSSAITLTTDVIFQPECTGTQPGETFPIGYLRDPFYASTIPMVYVVAAATVIAWVLVVMLTITPRTSFFGLPNTAPAFTNGHGIIGGANGGMSGLSGSGSRPWLQKVATILVAISLTIATADTLEVAQNQYYAGYMDAGDMRKEVLGSLEIRITRVISDIFLWLAQVQTLIRLFPRHKEKVLIKWIGFVLIILDTIFSCLNSFLINSQPKGRHFVDAIPALSYLFELALGLLYAAWVMYYSLTKRRYSFYHPKMRSISLIALLSLVSILTPVVFFITDVSNQDVAGWGDYFRWVGAAAASVVVWEWVERIEALERDDKKDGILGREVFDGDEMLDVMPSEEAAWTQSRSLRRNFRRPGGRDDDPEGINAANVVEQGLTGVAHRFRQRHQQSPQHFPLGRTHSSSEPNSSSDQQARADGRTGTVTFDDQPRPSEQRRSNPLGGPTPPPPIASPVSRDESNSAASTVYVVRYHPVADVPQPIRRRNQTRKSGTQQRRSGGEELNEKDIIEEDEDEVSKNRHREQSRWLSVPNPFKRKRTSPPQEVQRARAAATDAPRATTPASTFTNWDLRNRLGAFTNDAGGKLRDRTARRKPDAPLPVTIIPAQSRGSGRTWSPDQHIIMTSPAPAQTPAPVSAPAGATDNEGQDPRNSNGATSTTLTSESQQAQVVSTLQAAPPRAQDFSPSQPVTGRSTASPTIRSGPPRADDISPVNRRAGTVVVPAPRRTPTQLNTEVPSRNNTSSAGSAITGSHRHTPSNG